MRYYITFLILSAIQHDYSTSTPFYLKIEALICILIFYDLKTLIYSYEIKHLKNNYLYNTFAINLLNEINTCVLVKYLKVTQKRFYVNNHGFITKSVSLSTIDNHIGHQS